MGRGLCKLGGPPRVPVTCLRPIGLAGQPSTSYRAFPFPSVSINNYRLPRKSRRQTLHHEHIQRPRLHWSTIILEYSLPALELPRATWPPPPARHSLPCLPTR